MNETSLQPLLSEQSLLWVIGAVFLLAVVAGLCFTVILRKDPAAIKHFRGGRALHHVTVFLVVFATVVLGLERVIAGEAVAGLLGGIIGYVLGSLKNSPVGPSDAASEREDEGPFA